MHDGFIKSIEEIEAKLSALNEAMRVVKRSWVRDKCPFRVGDVETVGRSGLAHVGKRAKIHSITVRHNGMNWVWRLSGTVLNKDGTSGERRPFTADWDVYIHGLEYK